MLGARARKVSCHCIVAIRTGKCATFPAIGMDLGHLTPWNSSFAQGCILDCKDATSKMADGCLAISESAFRDP